MSPVEFDRFARNYEQDLAKSLAVTGEGRSFYAQRRIDWTAECCARLRYPVRQILEYGCGDGANAPMLETKFRATCVMGVDVSGASIALARKSNYGPGILFLCIDQWTPDAAMDLAFTNGVFHHIQPSERARCLAAIRRSLKAGGVFAFWENNPWNPGTRYVMSQCAFDENAITISPREACGMLAHAGFKILRFDSLFYFPHALRLLRPTESWLRKLPFGGQYQVLCESSSL